MTGRNSPITLGTTKSRLEPGCLRSFFHCALVKEGCNLCLQSSASLGIYLLGAQVLRKRRGRGILYPLQRT